MSTQLETHGPKLIDRFWSKVNKTSECWWWLRGKDRKGYGTFWVDGHTCLAHRVSWELTYGRPAGEMHVLHRCDNPSCVNPEHLFLGTNDDNVADRDAKGRHARMKGSDHSQAKLTEADVIAIRTCEVSGRQAAREYGVSPSAIARIRSRKSWAHV